MVFRPVSRKGDRGVLRVIRCEGCGQLVGVRRREQRHCNRECVRHVRVRSATDLAADRGIEAWWTEERILAAIRAYARRHGRPPIYREWVTHRRRGASWFAGEGPRRRPSSNTVLRIFGSWGAAVEAAGLKAEHDAHVRVLREYWWPKELIIQRIQEWHRRYGRPPSSNEWKAATTDDHPSFQTVRLKFSSWNAALEAAGFMTPQTRWRLTRERVDSALRGDWQRTNTVIAAECGCTTPVVAQIRHALEADGVIPVYRGRPGKVARREAKVRQAAKARAASG